MISYSIMKYFQWSTSLDNEHKRYGGVSGGSGGHDGGGHHGPGVPVMAWSPSVVTGENTSETESIESRESAKSRETSPSHSPLVSLKTFPNYQTEVLS